MKIVLNPQFEFLKDFVFNIPSTFATSGKVIYKGRNEIRVITVNGIQVNVKKYKIPILINKIVYTFFRPPKARRAYEYALQVLGKGIETPTPIAYIEKKVWGLFSEGYFISLQCPYSHTAREFAGEHYDLAGKQDILMEFARFTAQVHENGMLHKDYSPGNILFDKIAGEVHFSIVDLNRMKFCPVSEDLGCQNFERFWGGSEEVFRFMASKYAQARGFDVEKCQEKVVLYYNKRMKYYQNKDIILKKERGKNYRACVSLLLDNAKYLISHNLTVRDN